MKRNKNEISFVLDIDPPTTTSQQHRFGGYDENGKAIIFDSPKLKAARRLLSDYLGFYAPMETFSGPLSLEVTWRFKVKDTKKWGRYKTSKPDTDNLDKLLKDCMTECGFWNDDAQVASEHIEKFWDEKGSITISVKRLESEDEG